MSVLLFVLILATIVTQGSAGELESSIFTINVNDILDERLMPATFLMLEGADDLGKQPTAHSRSDPVAEKLQFTLANLTKDDGTFGTAFSTMKFHRKMMNNYLVNGFLTNQMISDMFPEARSFGRRLGTSLLATDSNLVSPGTGQMLHDQGSSGYKKWLAKSSTLEDIYRNFLSPGVTPANVSNHRSDASSPRAGFEDDYFDEGVITGYAVHHPNPVDPAYPPSYDPPYPRNRYSHPNRRPVPGPIQPQGLLQGETSFDAARGDYSYHPSIEYEEEKAIGKGLGLKDLFNIALTTLAFLSFGMFVLQVIMCITMAKNDANMMMIPVNTGDGEGEMEVRHRTARSLPNSDDARLREINAISRKVLDSMDAVVIAGQDEGHCVQKVICGSNRFSRGLKFNRGYWMAVWNLGISWLAGNMVAEEAKSETILGCIRAMTIGFVGGDCNQIYNCNREF
ncbi:uncharacterized protein LOC129732141 [Wyeomyia smithii]|uniref:uncharacterized protein LOC129732141 n=1 Tax=Wyeomyia smithii TaxID=174621 RepID=UPI00246813F3|nr:uncharacterized protein LOC129732141 [Wyeomyia smithii]